MSRRYGRRQRRAAREQIEALTRDAFQLFTKSEQQQRDIVAQRALYYVLMQRIEDWDSEIRSMLGPYTSFAIDDTTFRVDSLDSIRQMAVMPPLSLSLLSPDSVPDQVSYHVYRVLNIVASLEERDLMTIRQYLRLRIACGTDQEGEVYLGMSEPHWRHLQHHPEARPRIVRDIAEHLLHKLAEPPKPKPRPLPSESWVDARR